MDRMFDLVSKIDDVLTESHASTGDVMTVGVQLIKSAFAQIAEDNAGAELIALADSISDTLNRSLRHITLYPQETAEA